MTYPALYSRFVNEGLNFGSNVNEFIACSCFDVDVFYHNASLKQKAGAIHDRPYVILLQCIEQFIIKITVNFKFNP